MTTDEINTFKCDCGDTNPETSNIFNYSSLINEILDKISQHTDNEIKRFEKEIRKFVEDGIEEHEDKFLTQEAEKRLEEIKEEDLLELKDHGDPSNWVWVNNAEI